MPAEIFANTCRERKVMERRCRGYSSEVNFRKEGLGPKRPVIQLAETASPYAIVAFDPDDNDQPVKAFDPRTATDEAAAIEEARDLANRHVGVIVWKREGNPVVGEEGDPEIVFRSGKTGDFA